MLQGLVFCNNVRCFAPFPYQLRQKVNAHLSFFYLHQLPIPRLTRADAAFRPLVERAARLVGTSAEFDDLLREVFGPAATHRTHAATAPADRQRLRAELDALVAHLYALTEDEFTHILATFPLVDEGVKAATLETFREFTPHPDDVALARVIAAGERDRVEFKVAAVWNAHRKERDDKMRHNVVEAVAGFMNAYGGTLILGVSDAGEILGLAEDMKAADAKKPNADGYELWLRNFLRSSLGAENTKQIAFTFHTAEGKPVCRIAVKPAPQPVFLDGKLFVRQGNQTPELNAQEATAYQKNHWHT